MPVNSLWKSRIPEILEEIQRSGKPTFTRSDIEKLLNVASSRAKSIMSAAGAKTQARVAATLDATSFGLYLDSQCTAKVKAEWERRKKLAARMVQEDHEKKLQGITWKESPEKFERRMSRAKWRWDELHPATRIEKGHLTVEFVSMIDLFSQLMTLCHVIADNEKEAGELFEGLLDLNDLRQGRCRRTKTGEVPPAQAHESGKAGAA
ncbi:MAG TPA: hypothetical protein VFD30_20435 [Terriglobia bacterium]|nr:hypothetical protein [Terriglobia bacterium]